MKKKIKRICLFLFIGMAYLSQAQITWYFGNGAGLKFNKNGTTELASDSPISTAEGSAVLVNQQNNVVMYTDGTNVWNGAHVLQNINNNSDLAGHPSSTQTALIVPIPGTLGSQAFIFTVNAWENAYGNSRSNLSGLRVSLATISGTAPQTTVSVTKAEFSNCLTPAEVTMSEKLTLTEDGEGGYWILCHGVGVYSASPGGATTTAYNTVGENKFYAYHVNCSSDNIATLKATEVISEIDEITITKHQSWPHTTTGIGSMGNSSQSNGGGQMKFSTDGTKIACLLPWLGNNNWAVNPVCQLYNFDKNTGEVSNPIEVNLGFNHTATNSKDGCAYGVEFSSSDKYLYVSSSFGGTEMGETTPRIYQYDISSWNATIIKGTKYKVTDLGVQTTTNSYFAMQKGSDNKIYIARNAKNALDVINNPNGKEAACDYSPLSIAISGTCKIGLPTTVLISNNPAIPVINGDSVFCQGSPINLNLSYLGNAPETAVVEIYGSNASGNPVDIDGKIVSDLYSAFYWNGVGVLGLPVLADYLGEVEGKSNCNRYYTIKTTLYSECYSVENTSLYTFSIKCATNPSFSVASNTSNAIFFTVTATPNELNPSTSAGFYYFWRIEDLDKLGNAIFKVDNPGNWWIFPQIPSNTFTGFDHVANAYSGTISTLPSNTPAYGQFLYDHTYRITRGTYDSICGWKQFALIQSFTPHSLVNGRPQMIFVEDPNAPDFSYIRDTKTATGIKDAEIANQLFDVYPNPSNGIFNIESIVEQNVAMEVYDMTGKVIKRAQLNKNKPYVLDLSAYSKGIYIIKVNGINKQIKKIILQ